MIIPAWSVTGLVLIGGAIIGSFLSVLASRIPKVILGDGPSGLRAVLLGISWPGSHCSVCAKTLGWHENIPVLSYLLLRGRCRACDAFYGSQYIVLEIGSASAAVLCVWLFGLTGEAAFCFTFLALLMALTAIDLKTQLLPDVLVLPLLPLGIAFQSYYRDGISSAAMGMAIGYLVMWTIGAVYRMGTGREGMGFGDVKLAGTLGAWLGSAGAPLFLFGAFAVGLFAVLPLLALGKINSKTAVPFGPFLCLSAVFFVLIPSAANWTEAALGTL